VSSAAVAQTADPHHADATTSQVTPSPDSDDMASQGQNEQPAQPGMMGRTMMQSGMMGGMPMMGMRSHMMKIMFAVADVDGDGALSLEEVTTIHKRIFDKVDANKDGKVTPDEVQAFMRP
jgi:predicted lipid-binding transport protein (Tim44 family)